MRLTLRGHSLLQNLAVSGLRIAKVHQLIHQLIYDDKVVSDAFFLQFFEILRENLKNKVYVALLVFFILNQLQTKAGKSVQSYLDDFIQEGKDQ